MAQRVKHRTGSAFPLLSDPSGYGMPEHVRSLFAIDPGTRHCGMALFTLDEGGWCVDSTMDLEPLECLARVRRWVEYVAGGVLVVEGFQLYPTMLQEQGLSRMGTPEVLGALKYLYLRDGTAPHGRVGFVEQGASIKAAGRRYMERKGIAHVGSNIHKRDAEAHGWYRVRKVAGD
jgi:hypothetical protein